MAIELEVPQATVEELVNLTIDVSDRPRWDDSTALGVERAILEAELQAGRAFSGWVRGDRLDSFVFERSAACLFLLQSLRVVKGQSVDWLDVVQGACAGITAGRQDVLDALDERIEHLTAGFDRDNWGQLILAESIDCFFELVLGDSVDGQWVVPERLERLRELQHLLEPSYPEASEDRLDIEQRFCHHLSSAVSNLATELVDHREAITSDEHMERCLALADRLPPASAGHMHQVAWWLRAAMIAVRRSG